MALASELSKALTSDLSESNSQHTHIRPLTNKCTKSKHSTGHYFEPANYILAVGIVVRCRHCLCSLVAEFLSSSSSWLPL